MSSNKRALTQRPKTKEQAYPCTSFPGSFKGVAKECRPLNEHLHNDRKPRNKHTPAPHSQAAKEALPTLLSNLQALEQQQKTKERAPPPPQLIPKQLQRRCQQSWPAREHFIERL